jgi:dipeptidyl aminopeptidase/acylaminoacyl peptidase
MSKAPRTEWTPEVMMQVKGISGVRVSPDGRRVAFAVRRAVMEGERSEYLTQITLTNVDGSDQLQLTHGEKSSGNPQWSPDGQWIAFTSDRSGKSNVWRVPVRGGEAQQLTDVQTGVGSFRWSPDGRWIAFTAMDPPTPQEEQAAKEKSDAWVVDENIKMHHLYVIPADIRRKIRRDARQLTAGDYTVGIHGMPGLYDWSPDGRGIAFTHARTPKADDWTSAGISLVDVGSATVRPLVRTEGPALDPMFSPDGHWIAYKQFDVPSCYWDSVVHIVPASGGEARPLAETFDGRPHMFGWSADGTRLYYLEWYGTTVRLCALPLDGAPEVIYEAEGVIWGDALNQARTLWGFTLEGADRPPEAFVSRMDDFAPIQVSRVNQGASELPLGRTEVIRGRSMDGLEIEGLLTYPVGYQTGKRYPLLLSIHGGPAGVWLQAFIGTPSMFGPFAALAARGYAVLRCNVRGSTGYGKAFRHANYRDWGGMDFQDLMAGVDHVIAMGVADSERLGVMGWSYGGFLAAAAITQTRRFRAAVVGAGITNLISNAGTADIPSDIPEHFGGEPRETLELLCAHSPVLHMEGVNTPTLILHGERDERVPISQGYELYNALKRQGGTVRMVVYPRTPHIPQEPKLYQDVMIRSIDWLDRFVRGSEP